MSIHEHPSASPVQFNSEDHILLTLNQAANTLAISRRTLSRLISNGTFPTPLKIGRSSRIARDDIAGFLEELRRVRGDKLGTS